MSATAPSKFKTAVFITARSSASRLPGKVLEKVCGLTLLELLIERVKPAGFPVIVTTTTDPSDNKLAVIAKSTGAEVFRGSVEDVLLRYREAARFFSVEEIIIADGDDLFVEPILIKEVAGLLQKQEADFVSVKDMPYGSFPYGMNRSSLEKVCEIKDEKETEGWGRYFTQTGLFRTHTINAPQKWKFPQYRMTLDYPEDLKFIQTVYERLYRPGHPLELSEVFALLQAEPDIAAINSGKQDEYLARFRSKYSHVKVKKDE